MQSRGCYRLYNGWPSPKRLKVSGHTATKFLITGSTSFVGRELLAQLIGKYGPAAVTAMVNVHLKPLEENALRALEKQKVRVIQCDLLELPRLDVPVPSFDVLYHLAAYVETEKASSRMTVNTQYRGYKKFTRMARAKSIGETTRLYGYSCEHGSKTPCRPDE